ncbi:MAG: 2OG-Fe(II) oxygenase [Proteobacteria bacterium]|nr:2OG-Fe(II) oxygenase [Pseudomonadota bacterium]
MVTNTESGSRDAVATRCPHVIFRDVLGAKAVAGLLAHVAATEADFKPREVLDRETGHRSIDVNRRRSVWNRDLGGFAAPIAAKVRKIIAPTFDRLQLSDVVPEPKGLEINAYGDGSQFGAHVDNINQVAKLRMLSCVYYFSMTPRRFSGGELRIYPLPTLSAGDSDGSPAFIDIVPEPDTMVVFLSWLRHEVRPVSVPSKAWIDSRFTVNCWLHRAGSPDGTP